MDMILITVDNNHWCAVVVGAYRRHRDGSRLMPSGSSELGSESWLKHRTKGDWSLFFFHDGKCVVDHPQIYYLINSRWSTNRGVFFWMSHGSCILRSLPSPISMIVFPNESKLKMTAVLIQGLHLLWLRCPSKLPETYSAFSSGYGLWHFWIHGGVKKLGWWNR